METPAQGTPPAEQPVIGTQPVEQASQQNNGQPSPPASAQPTVEALQQQLETERQQRQHAEQQYAALQPEYTRARQTIAQLAGAAPQQPQPDPIAQRADFFTKRGYDAKQARDLAEFVTGEIAPLQQQFQQQIAATQQASQVDFVLNQAAQFDPALFPNQQAYDSARNTALQFVQQGGQLNRELIVDMAAVAAYRASRQNGGQPTQPAFTPPPGNLPPMPPQPFAGGQFRIQPSYTPQQPTTAQLPPEAQRVADEMKARFNPSPK